MFVRIALVALAIVFLPQASADAQLFRRFFSPAGPPPGYRPPTPQYRSPYQGGAPQQSAAQQSIPQRYYRLPNGQVVVAPAPSSNPGTQSPQPGQPNRTPVTSTQTDIARMGGQPGTNPSPAAVQPTLQGPLNQSASVNSSRTAPATAVTSASPTQPQTYQPQQYRRVVVYNPYTRQRSIRLIPIPPAGATGQSAQPTAATKTTVPGRATSVVTGTLTPPSGVTAVPMPAIASSVPASPQPTPVDQPAIRLDSQVSPATFNAPASTIVTPPVAAPERSQPVRRANGQFSVLDLGDDDKTEERGVALELAAPAN